MQFLYFLEKLRVPVLNAFFLLITKLGEETAFLALALIFFWCVDKRRGYYLMAVGFAGTITSQALKIACRIPRPWVLDPDFTILEKAREAAAGYSFPSGHTQTAVGTFGAIAATAKKKSVAVTCVVLALLVGFSRMYIGVHTPADVLVGGGLSILFLVAFYPLMFGKKNRTYPLAIGLAVVTAVYLIVMETAKVPSDIDAHNLESAMKNAYTLAGCMAALLVVYPLEKKYVNFSEKGVWWVQLLKIVLGLGVVLAVKEGLRSPLEALFAGHLAARAVRYFLIVIVAGLLWPLSFKYLNKLDKKR